MLRPLLTTILILTCHFSLAQPDYPNAMSDSLWNTWEDENAPDTTRLKALKKYLDGYLFTIPDSAIYYAEIMHDYAEKRGEIEYVSAAFQRQGIAHQINGDYDQAIHFYNRSLEVDRMRGFKKGIANNLNNIGIIYENQGNLPKALEYYSESLKIKEEIGNKEGILGALNNLGNIYSNLGEYESAIKNYKQSIQLAEELGLLDDLALAQNNLGATYLELGQDSLAMDFFQQSLSIREENGDDIEIAESLINIGYVYSEWGKNDRAMEYYMRSLSMFEEIGYEKGVAMCLSNIGNIYYEQKQYNQALSYGQRSLKILLNIGSVEDNLAQTALLLSKTNKAIGKYKQSLEMFELYVSTRDSIESAQNKKEVIRQQYKYTYEKQATADSVAFAKEKEIADVQIEKQNAELRANRNRQFALIGGLVLIAVFAFFMYNRFKVTNKQKLIIENAHSELEEKNQEILDSITYAKRIQTAILPPDKLVKSYLTDSFILYKPKDIVAGDFYWIEKQHNHILFAAADCTGHGVPGAMVSVICNNGLNRSVREFGLSEPGAILDKTRKLVIAEFEKSEEEVKDGMDIALCSLRMGNDNNAHSILQYAGAHNSLWMIRKGSGELEEIKADKQPIGKYAEAKPFTTHEITLQPGDTIYTFSDGFADQFGGDKGKKFKAKNFKSLLISIQNEPMNLQKVLIEEAFENWRGNLEQLDDVCVIGVRV